MRRSSIYWLAAIAFVLGVSETDLSAEIDEFKVKRQEVFEFTEKPTVNRDGDKVTIRFASKDFCDATVAIEDGNGKIVRHLASGVLGLKAPQPFARGTLQQTLVWDCKDDQGRYVDNAAGLAVRVSLGLQPRFERTLFWSPKQRLSERTVLMQPSEAGVLVYDGDVVDHVRLFDHQGNYLQTVYPPPAGRLGDLAGLRMHAFPQDGVSLPLKEGFFQATLLTAGPNAGGRHADGMPGRAASAMAVGKDRVAIVDLKLNRLGADGGPARSDAGQPLPLTGPKTAVSVKVKDVPLPLDVVPQSAAFSPDGKYLYLAAYYYKLPFSYMAQHYCLPAVLRMEFAADKEPELFAGSLRLEDQGPGPGQFSFPASVACDAAGRVYVADFVNDRVQVLGPDGKLLKSIRTRKPAQVCVHQKTGQIYVFSWAMPNHKTYELSLKPATLTRFGPFDDPKQIDQFELPVPEYLDTVTTWYGGSHIGHGWGQPLHAAVDSWADTPTIWLSRESVYLRNPWQMIAVRMFAIRDGKLVKTRRFADDLAADLKRLQPPVFERQRLYANPKDRMLYIAEGHGYCKSFQQVVRVDPGSGRVAVTDLPFSAEDMAFDLAGQIYLRTNKELARYDPVTWREVPFDYGEERAEMGYTASGMGLKTARVQSAVALPAPAGWHHGGMWVSALGDIAVSCYNKTLPPNRQVEKDLFRVDGYVPPLFPGRARFGELHVWDAHGKLIREDAVQGLGILNGVGLDRDGGLYVLASRNRVVDGKPYFNSMAGTLMKFPRPDRAEPRGRVLSTHGAPVPLDKEGQPARAADIVNGPHGSGWVEGAAWKYGGVGFGGKNPGVGCACWNCRFSMDYFARSFVPEIDHCSVAVLDSAGNLILRVGRFGNVDDGRPLVPDGGPPKTQTIGGDEVALFYACFVASDTDHRLFIADAGNARIVSVKLDYHRTETVPLGDRGPKAPAP